MKELENQSENFQSPVGENKEGMGKNVPCFPAESFLQEQDFCKVSMKLLSRAYAAALSTLRHQK